VTRGVGGVGLAPSVSRLTARVSGQSGFTAPLCGKPPAFRSVFTPQFAPRRLEGLAFQPARRRFFRAYRLRKGEAFPQSRRRSRGRWSTGSCLIWTTLGLALALEGTASRPPTRAMSSDDLLRRHQSSRRRLPASHHPCRRHHWARNALSCHRSNRLRSGPCHLPWSCC
jgi:hypothetical protein